uniref:Uncharacterized protein n=1 Tax=Rhizophora mucronata TaxID=61149 RepID=A0A2P2R4L1_RHIMU
MGSTSILCLRTVDALLQLLPNLLTCTSKSSAKYKKSLSFPTSTIHPCF